jgi:hypothetical protein
MGTIMRDSFRQVRGLLGRYAIPVDISRPA